MTEWLPDAESPPGGETLREAARAIRADFSGPDNEFETAVADWLEHESYRPETELQPGLTTGGPSPQARAVAQAALRMLA